MATTKRKLSLSTAEKETQNELLMQQTQAREEELVNLGFTFDTDEDMYHFGKLHSTIAAIREMDNPSWDIFIKDIISEIDRTAEKEMPLSETEILEFSESTLSVVDTDKKNLAVIAHWKDACKGLVIKDLTDKDTYKKVSSAKSFIRKRRTSLEKTRKEMNEDILARKRAIDGTAKKYEALIMEIEEPLDKQLDQWEAWKTAEETRKAREEQEELDRRVNVLKDAGMSFNGFMYVIGETISLDIATLKALSQDQLNDLVGRVTLEKKRIDDAAEVIRLQKIADDEKAENDRIELKRQQQELSLRQKEMEEERQRQAEEVRLFNEEKEKMRLAKVEMRKDKCKLLGMQQGVNGMYFSNTIGSSSIYENNIWDSNNEVFEHLLSKAASMITDFKTKQSEKYEADRLKKEQDEADRLRYNNRVKQLYTAGFVDNGNFMLFKNDFDKKIIISFDEIKAKEEVEWTYAINQFIGAIEEINTLIQQREADRAKKAEEAQNQFIARCQQFIQIGMVRESKEDNHLQFKNRAGRFQLGFSDIRNSEDFPTMLNNSLINIHDLEKKAKQQEINEANERESAKSDAQRLREYIGQFQPAELAGFKNKKIINIKEAFRREIQLAIETATTRLNEIK